MISRGRTWEAARATGTGKLRFYGTALRGLGIQDRRVTYGGRTIERRTRTSRPERRKGPCRASAHAQLAKDRSRQRIRARPLHRRPEPSKPGHLQADPHGRSGRLEGALHRLTSRASARTETSSPSIDSTSGPPPRGGVERGPPGGAGSCFLRASPAIRCCNPAASRGHLFEKDRQFRWCPRAKALGKPTSLVVGSAAECAST